MSKQKLENIFTNPSPSFFTSTSTDTNYKPKMISGTFDGRYVEYKRNIQNIECIEKTRPHLHDLINNLQKSIE